MNNNTPRVSIIIPCYNHEKFVKETIQSVIDQDYQNIELIIIDDGSKDSSVKVIEEMIPQCKERFARFEFRTRKNKGICFTLNEALDWCEGEFLTGVASDDMIKNHKISVQVDYLIKNTNSIGVFGGIEHLYEDSGVRVVRVTPPKKYNFKEIFLLEHDLPASTSLLRIENLRKLGGYKAAYLIEDWSLWLSLTEHGGTLDYIDRVMGTYRRHQNNISSNPDWMQRGMLEVVNLFSDHPLYKKALANTYMNIASYWVGVNFKKSISCTYKAIKINYKTIFSKLFIITMIRIPHSIFKEIFKTKG